jgi:sigma-E factor negative regulatory protein RseA
MTEVNRENLSAGMDGQLSKEELRFLLRRFESDASLSQAWTRYHLVRDGLRRELPSVASEGFAARVMLAIDQDTMITVAPQGRRRWLHWSAGGAIAASVAIAALLVTQPAGQEGSDRGSPLVAANNSATNAAVTQAVPTHNSATPAQAPAWLNSYASLPSQLSERASATIDANEGPLFYSQSEKLSPYQVRGYRVINHGNGSYLLISPDQAAPQQSLPQARAVGQ